MKFSKFSKGLAVLSAAACMTSMSASVMAADSYSVSCTAEGNGTASASVSSQTAGAPVTLNANPGSGAEFDHWEITTSGYSRTASVVFVVDTSGSMSNDIKSVRENLTSLVTSLDAKDMGLNIALIEYSDAKHYPETTNYVTFANGSHWTSDVNEAITEFDKINDGSGYDETPTDAFSQLLTSDGKLDFPTGSVNNYIFLLTDEGYYDYKDDPDSNHYSMDTWIDKFVDSIVRVSVVTEDSYKDDYEDLFTDTNGIFIDIDSEDYGKLMEDFASYLDNTSVSTTEKIYENPCTFTMPANDVSVKAVFKGAEKSAHKITVITDGHGTAYASHGTAYAGTSVTVFEKADSGYVFDSMECVNGGVSLNGRSFTMPDCDVTILVNFKEDVSKYIAAALPHSYVFSYDSDMTLIDTNSNRDFDSYPSYVEITIDLGEEYAGRTGNICKGRKSSSSVIESITLDDNGRYTFKADISKNYSFVLD